MEDLWIEGEGSISMDVKQEELQIVDRIHVQDPAGGSCAHGNVL